VQSAIRVLEGRNDEAQVELARRMESAAERLNFEDAARARDQLKALRALQAQQIVTAELDHDADVIAIGSGGGEFCIALMFVRGGRSLGSTTYFPKAPLAELPEVLAAFVTQYYLERESPAEIIVETEFDEMEVLESTLAQRAGRKVRITASVRGIRARWLEMMHENAVQALKMRALARGSIEASLEDVREAFDLAETPSRIECFDISHTGARTRSPRAWCSAWKDR
jgi:excinuclease ABC subunit C